MSFVDTIVFIFIVSSPTSATRTGIQPISSDFDERA